jgi:MFS family permease
VNPVGRTFLPRIDGLPTTYWYLWAGMLVNRMGAFVVPFLTLYLTQSRAFSPAEAGFVVSLWGAGSLMAGPVGGFLADRRGRRFSMLLALTAGAASMLALGFARTTGEIMTATFALGFFGEMYRPGVVAAIGDVVRPEDRTRAFGFLYWAINLGFSIAPVVASFMVSRSFLFLFVADAASTLIFAAIVWARVPETRPLTPIGEPREILLGARWTAPYTDGVFLVFVLISFVGAVVFAQHLVGLPLDMAAHGIDAARYGLLVCVNGLLIVIVQPIAAQWLDRFPKNRVLASGALLVGVGFGLTALASTPAQYVGSIVVWSLGEIALLPVASTVITDLAPPSLRGSYQGVYQLAWGAAFSVAPTLGGGVIARLGAPTLWAGCFIAGLLVALGHLAVGPANRRRARDLQRLAA